MDGAMIETDLYRLTRVNVPEAVSASFDDLELDPYHTDGSRRRRFAQYRIGHDGMDWTISRLPQRPFVQPKHNNYLAGGLARYFKPVTADLTPLLRTALALIAPDASVDWQINVHQYRIEATADRAGTPVPEGAHRDGVDHIMMVCINRNNVVGGETSLYDDGQVVFKTTLQAGDAVVIDDRRLFHDASQINVDDPTRPGHRDLFVIALMHWSYGKYGPEYEREHTGAEADPQTIAETLT